MQNVYEEKTGKHFCPSKNTFELYCINATVKKCNDILKKEKGIAIFRVIL
jgi:hypothetical protein